MGHRGEPAHEGHELAVAKRTPWVTSPAPKELKNLEHRLLVELVAVDAPDGLQPARSGSAESTRRPRWNGLDGDRCCGDAGDLDHLTHGTQALVVAGLLDSPRSLVRTFLRSRHGSLQASGALGAQLVLANDAFGPGVADAIEQLLGFVIVAQGLGQGESRSRR